ncbi:HAMP domain-containing sensor histidine kinase [Hydrogenophaga sp. PAMC20947]|uniref:sensor histidine kinase n=1 Tax=Hydrogenophaga sp. PAMC20947 TaxID=2565558 RepID=UPI001447A768|nr:HAMP domain-containing sensor histidine kinase [Hydrogenophaga sp. PAMC20947]
MSASPEVRDEWVTSQLIGVLMGQAMPSLIASILALPVVGYLMVGEVQPAAVGGWAIAMLVILLYRYHKIGLYRTRYDSVEGPMRTEFMRHYAWAWGFAGFLWGSTVAMTYLQTDLLTQFVVGIVVVGNGFICLASFSSFLPVFRIYTRGMMISVLLGLCVPMLFQPLTTEIVKVTLSLALLALIFWWLLTTAGKRLNQVHRASLELQFSNQELIDSLTQQTRASIRAVATKNRFLASAAHDLRQPVHALSLYADWLATEPEMARDIAPRILQSTRAINELFDSLFDLTRIDAGNYKVRLQNVDVAQLFKDLVTQFEPVASGKSLRLRTYAKPRTVWADPVVLRRILGNLLSNALRHTSQGGVLMSLREREGMLVFEVWDTGVGIAHEHQMSIFQEFFRVAQHQGTEDSLGLGLTIVSKLTTLMGYQLALSSEEGKGSVFRVLLPAFTQTSVEASPLMPEVVLNSEFTPLL